MSCEVKILQASDIEQGARWDAFVEEHLNGTFFHLSGWQRVLNRAFGHKTFFLYAEEDGQILGVLPVAEVRSVLFGRRLASLPFCVYGGVLANTQAASELLASKACEIARERKAGSLELRSIDDTGRGWPQKQLYFTFRKELSANHSDNLLAIPNRQRAMLRKALTEGLFGEEVQGDAGIERLYRVYSESVRNLGTPVFSLRYLMELKREFAENCRVLIIKQSRDGQAVAGSDNDALMLQAPTDVGAADDVAGVLSFYFRDEVLPYYGGSIGRARSIKGANHFLYWDLIRRSVDEGLRVFDFGRSKADSGPFAFKKNMGFEATRLHYEYFLVEDSAVPDVNPNNPKYQVLINVWKKLPLPLANTLGPIVAKSLG